MRMGNREGNVAEIKMLEDNLKKHIVQLSRSTIGKNNIVDDTLTHAHSLALDGNYDRSYFKI